MNRDQVNFWLNHREDLEWKVFARAGKLVEAIKSLRLYSESYGSAAGLGLKDAKDIVVEYRDIAPTPKEDQVTTLELDVDNFGNRTVLRITKLASGEGYKIEQVSAQFAATEKEAFAIVSDMTYKFANRYSGPFAS